MPSYNKGNQRQNCEDSLADEHGEFRKETPRKKRKIQNLPKRYWVILLLFLGNWIEAYLMKNTSLVIVHLTSPKSTETENGTKIHQAEFGWTPREISVTLSMDALGHIFAGIFGIIMNRLPGGTFRSVSAAMEAVISLATPLTINAHLYLFAANRFALGFFAGLSFISLADIYVHWTPSGERARLVTYAMLGYGFGLASTYPLSGLIIHTFGWQFLFYILGAAILIWSIIWTTFVGNDPATDRFISKEEKNYLSREITYRSKNKMKIPYRSIFTSVATYALLNEILISTFTAAFMFVLPLYIKDVYDADIQTIGLISGIPELGAFFVRPLIAYFADCIRSRPRGYSLGKIHKLFLFWGQSFAVVFYFLAAISNNLTGCIICLALARISYSVSQVSYDVIPVDVAGQYAFFLQSVALSVGTMTHFVNPIIIGFLIPNHSEAEWNRYFFLVSFLTMYAVIIFVIFGSGDLQPWAEVQRNEGADENDDEAGTEMV